jgi:hypothetical protein
LAQSLDASGAAYVAFESHGYGLSIFIAHKYGMKQRPWLLTEIRCPELRLLLGTDNVEKASRDLHHPI